MTSNTFSSELKNIVEQKYSFMNIEEPIIAIARYCLNPFNKIGILKSIISLHYLMKISIAFQDDRFSKQLKLISRSLFVFVCQWKNEIRNMLCTQITQNKSNGFVFKTKMSPQVAMTATTTTLEINCLSCAK